MIALWIFAGIVAYAAAAVTLGWWLGGRFRAVAPKWARELDDQNNDLMVAMEELRGRLG